MRFGDIPLKEQVKTQLIQQVKEDRIPHAQLFIGRPGTATLPLALAFSTYLVCTNKQEQDSCGECPSCKQATKYIYPDIHYAFPVIKKEGKNRDETTSDDFLPQWRSMIQENPYFDIFDWQHKIESGNLKPNINVRECNSIIHKLSLQSFADGPKILIMWLPEYLGKEGNRLLKLIEEPTPNTLILLIAEDQNRILNTVLSRCQLVKNLPYAEAQIVDILTQDLSVSEEEATQAAILAEGNLNKALHIAKGESIRFSEQLFSWLRVAYKCDPVEMQQLTLSLANQGKDLQIQFLQYGLKFLRELLYLSLTNLPPNLAADEVATAQKMKAILPPEKIQLVAELFDNSIMHINRNANMKVAYMATTISIGDVMRG